MASTLRWSSICKSTSLKEDIDKMNVLKNDGDDGGGYVSTLNSGSLWWLMNV